MDVDKIAAKFRVGIDLTRYGSPGSGSIKMTWVEVLAVLDDRDRLKAALEKRHGGDVADKQLHALIENGKDQARRYRTVGLTLSEWELVLALLDARTDTAQEQRKAAENNVNETATDGA